MPSTYRLGKPSFQHQLDGLQAIINADGVYALFWDPGTGKTKVVIDYLGMMACATETEIRVLVTCPKAVTDSWQDQMDKFMGPGVGYTAEIMVGTINEKAARLVELGSKRPGALVDWPVDKPWVTMAIINIETLSSRRTVSKTNTKMHSDLLLDAVKKFKPHVLVVDESHRIKGNSSNAARLLARIGKTVKRRLLLTGTPMPHSPLDVWAQWQVLDPQAFSTNGKSWSFSRFRAKYAVSGGYMGKEVKGFQYLDDLEARIAVRSMVRTKVECLDLPPTMDVMYPVHLEPSELNAYKKLKRDMLLELENGSMLSTPSMVVLRTRLRQITCGFVKPDDSPDIKWIGTGRLTAAMSLLEDLMATEKRIVVFAWARPEVDRLVQMINSSHVLYGAKAYAITGDTSDAERLRLRLSFANLDAPDKQILVCQWRTVSLGINEFVAANHALFLSLSQQRDDLIQGKGRLDRQGQTKPVTFWWLQAPNTVDVIIQKSHQDRTDLEAALLAHIRGG